MTDVSRFLAGCALEPASSFETYEAFYYLFLVTVLDGQDTEEGAKGVHRFHRME